MYIKIIVVIIDDFRRQNIIYSNGTVFYCLEAKQLAMLTNIDAANLSRIEQGKYSVGFDILTKTSRALGVKVDLV